MELIKLDIPVNQKDFEDIITYSQAYSFPIDCTNLLKQWERNKKYFLTNNHFLPIFRTAEKFTFKTDDETNQRNFLEFYREIQTYTDNQDFLQFLMDNQDSFFENRISIAWPRYNALVNGKLSKSFKEFFEDKELIKTLQDIASRYIQLTKVTGYIYLSVHPIDYLTLSENAANWTSCHSLDGAYRAGNLSYMVDKSTIVAYLASEDMQHFKCLPDNMKWFSKKWRMLIHINSANDAVWYNKQYPFTHSELLDKVIKMVHYVFFPGEDSARIVNRDMAFRKIITNEGIRTIDEVNFYHWGKIYTNHDLINDRHSLAYNDLSHSISYLPIIDYPGAISSNTGVFNILIGEYPRCPICGRSEIEEHDKLCCPFCKIDKKLYDECYPYCAECGHRIYPSDRSYELDGEIVCKSCYSSLKEEKEEFSKNA